MNENLRDPEHSQPSQPSLNLEHKSLQDVYRATQSEPIRASYRPVEFALFKKKEKKKHRKGQEEAGDEEETVKKEMCVCVCVRVLLLTRCPLSWGFPKKCCNCCFVGLLRFVSDHMCPRLSVHNCLQYVRALCIGLGQPGPWD